eukprot:PhM_4_TR6883/c0_g1_i1/m.3117/K12410/npdA; NAD-dependent deacetylase
MYRQQLTSLLSSYPRLRNPSVLVLTGAGISTHSGMPVYREPGKRYAPPRRAQLQHYRENPDVAWSFYLKRAVEVGQCVPNDAHLALVELEKCLLDRFLLMTQNVDGLHRRAGSVRVRELHGNYFRLRCSNQQVCSQPVWLYSSDGDSTTPPRCPTCGVVARPDLMFFDEPYNVDEFNETLALARAFDILLIVGTSGFTNLPKEVCRASQSVGALLLEVNTEDETQLTRFLTSPTAKFHGTALDVLPEICPIIAKL